MNTPHLDLVIMGDTPLDMHTLARLHTAFEESDLPWRVDIVDWATTAEPFRRVIEVENIVLQEPQK